MLIRVLLIAATFLEICTAEPSMFKGSIAELCKKQYLVDTVVGEGSFGTVYKAEDVETKQHVAVKIMEIGKRTDEEVEVLKATKGHPNIVNFICSETFQDLIFIVMEYCPGGGLSSYLKQRGRLPEPVVFSMLKQLASALQHFYSLGFIHRDLKPANILLSAKQDDAILKVADFGFATRLADGDKIDDSFPKTRKYAAPEVLSQQPYDRQADLWSIGAITFSMVTNNNFPGKLELPPDHSISPEMQKLLESLLAQDVTKRATPEEFFRLVL